MLFKPSFTPERLPRESACVSCCGANMNDHFCSFLTGSEGKLTVVAQKMSVLSGRDPPGSDKASPLNPGAQQCWLCLLSACAAGGLVSVKGETGRRLKECL